MTGWKWVRIPGVLHDRMTAIAGAVGAERARREQARTEVRYYEVFEMAVDALERERAHGVDTGGVRGAAADAGDGDMGRVDDAGES